MARLRYNGVRTALGAALAQGDTTITITSPLTHAGGNVPTLANGDHFMLSVMSPTGVKEVLKVTAYTQGATTATVERGQESSTDQAHAQGAVVIMAATAGDIATIESNVAAAKVSPGLFRGVWAATNYSLVSTVDFEDGQTKAGITSRSGASVAATVGNASSAYQGFTKSFRATANLGVSDAIGIDLNLVTLGSPARIGVIQRYSFDGGYGGRYREILGATVTATGGSAWREHVIDPGANGTFQYVIDRTGGGGSMPADLEVAAVRIYAANPYKTGEFVVHGGLLYRSAIDNNASTPGADSNWVAVPIGVTDPEVVRDTMATALVQGTGVSITSNDAGDTITISASSSGGTFRGTWAADQVAHTFDLSSMPAQITTTQFGAYSTGVTAGVPSSDAGRTSPPASASALRLRVAGNQADYYARASINIAALGLTGVTRLTYKYASDDNNNASWGGSLDVERNGVQQSSVSIPGMGTAWQSGSVTIDSDDVVLLEADSGGGFDGAINVYVSDLVVYATSAPYMTGDTVVYQGKMWRSEIDNNAATPGADASWADLGVGSTDQEVVRDTMATALVGGPGVSITPNDGADTITVGMAGLPVYVQGSVPGGAVAPYLVVDPSTTPVSFYYEDGTP